MIEPSIQTNKAVIHFGENVVEKRFFDSERMDNEYRSMVALHTLFPGARHGDWSYRTAEPLECDPTTNSILMSRAHGVSGGQLFRKRPGLVSRKMGICLALFHGATRDSCGNVVVYSDFNRTNIIINEQSREVFALDPGGGFGGRAEPEVDVMNAAYSIAVGALKTPRARGPLLSTFIESYVSVLPLETSKTRLRSGMRSWQDFRKFHRRHWVLRTFYRLNILLLRHYIAGTLQRTMRALG